MQLHSHCFPQTTNCWLPTPYLKKNVNINRHNVISYAFASTVFTMLYDMALCLSLSVTSRCSTKTAKHCITQTKPHDSPGNLVFWCQRNPEKFGRSQPLRGCQMQVGWVKIGDFRPISGYISKTIQDRCTVSIKVE